MASQSYIMAQESGILEATSTVRELMHAVAIEVSAEQTGKLSDRNRDCWSTLRINAHMLECELRELLGTLRKHLDS
jgi:hypothetical protein